MSKIENINYIYLIIYCIIIYTYIFVAFDIPVFIINIYNYPIFKIIFLMGLYFFGHLNIELMFFLAINFVGLGLKIQNQELIK